MKNSRFVNIVRTGLEPKKHLGKSLKDMQSYLINMKDKFQLNVCGEGGEYETITLDCPLFLKKIVIDEMEMVIHSDDAFAPVGYLSFKKMHLVDKNIDHNTPLSQRLKTIKVPEPIESDIVNKLGRLTIESGSIILATHNDVLCSSTVMEDTMFNVYSHGDKTWVTEIICIHNQNESIEVSTKNTMDKLKCTLLQNGLQIKDITLVNLFCADMKHFSNINAAYKTYFIHNPPARVCVEAPLPKHILFKMDVLLHDSPSKQRDALHVQSISYWAPANIGPYSQAIKVDTDIYFSGSIGMIPSSMQVMTESIQQEAYLALQHVNHISEVISPIYDSLKMSSCITCYVTHGSYVPVAKTCFEMQNWFDTKTCILNLLVVPHLPRNANIEWHVISSSRETTSSYVDNEYSNTETELYQLNDKYVTLKLLCSDFQTDAQSTLSSVISCNYQILKECCFLRVYYVVGQYITNESIFIEAFRSIFRTKTQSDPAFSFIPVNGGSSADVVVLICGSYNKQNLGEDNNET